MKNDIVEMTEKQINDFIINETKKILQEKTRRYTKFSTGLNRRSELKMKLKKERLHLKELKNSKKLLENVIEKTNYKIYKQKIIDTYEPVLSELQIIGSLFSKNTILSENNGYIKYRMNKGETTVICYFEFLGRKYDCAVVTTEGSDDDILYNIEYFTGKKEVIRGVNSVAILERNLLKILKTRFSELIQANIRISKLIKDCNKIINSFKKEYENYIQDDDLKNEYYFENKKANGELLREFDMEGLIQSARLASRNFLDTAIDNLKFKFKKMASGEDVYKTIRFFNSAKKIQLEKLAIKYEKPLSIIEERISISKDNIKLLKEKIIEYGKQR